MIPTWWIVSLKIQQVKLRREKGFLYHQICMDGQDWRNNCQRENIRPKLNPHSSNPIRFLLRSAHMTMPSIPTAHMTMPSIPSTPTNFPFPVLPRVCRRRLSKVPSQTSKGHAHGHWIFLSLVQHARRLSCKPTDHVIKKTCSIPPKIYLQTSKLSLSRYPFIIFSYYDPTNSAT